MNWMLLDGRSESGPYTLDQLRQLAKDGNLHPQSQLREAAGKRIIQAHQVIGLFPDYRESSAGPVFNQPAGPTVSAHSKHVQSPSSGLARYQQSQQPTAVGSFVRRALLATILLAATIGGYLATRAIFFPPPPPVDLQAEVTARLDELNSRIARWKVEQAKVKGVIKTLEEDRQGLLWQFKRLGVYSPATANETPRGQALLQELRSLTDQLVRLRKKQEEYDLAIFQSESRLRTIERSLATSRVLANESELSELFAAVSAADSALAAETGESPNVELDKQLGTLLADLEDAEVGELEWSPEATVILLDLQPRDLTVSCFEKPGVKIEGTGRYRRVLVPEALIGQELQLDFLQDGYQPTSRKLTTTKGARENLSITLERKK